MELNYTLILNISFLAKFLDSFSETKQSVISAAMNVLIPIVISFTWIISDRDGSSYWRWSGVDLVRGRSVFIM